MAAGLIFNEIENSMVKRQDALRAEIAALKEQVRVNLICLKNCRIAGEIAANEAEARGIERAREAAHLEWFAGDRFRTAGVVGPAIDAAIRALKEPAP